MDNVGINIDELFDEVLFGVSLHDVELERPSQERHIDHTLQTYVETQDTPNQCPEDVGSSAVEGDGSSRRPKTTKMPAAAAQSDKREKRRIINERERARAFYVKEAFEDLRKVLPRRQRKCFSKLDTLTYATQYIKQLSRFVTDVTKHPNFPFEQFKTIAADPQYELLSGLISIRKLKSRRRHRES